MDHPFPTQRSAIERVTEGLARIADAHAIASLDAKNRARLLARREPEVSDGAARAALARRAGRLGLLLEDVDAALPGIAPTPLLALHKDAWTRFLTTGTAPLPAAALSALEAAACALRAQHAALVSYEGEDSGSSSVSDYSDSETQSTDEEDDGEGSTASGGGGGGSSTEED